MSNLEDYISILTPEEQETFKELIGECRRRELDTKLSVREARDSLDKREETNQRLHESLKIVGERAKKLEGILGDLSLSLHDTAFTRWADERF